MSLSYTIIILLIMAIVALSKSNSALNKRISVLEEELKESRKYKDAYMSIKVSYLDLLDKVNIQSTKHSKKNK